MGSVEIEVRDVEHVEREPRAQLQHHCLTPARFGGVGMFTDERFEGFGGQMGCGLISIERFDLIEVALSGAQQRVWHLFVSRVEIGEVLVVGECLFVAVVVEIGVRDLEQGLLFVIAIGVVVDDRLEEFDRPVIVDEGEDP